MVKKSMSDFGKSKVRSCPVCGSKATKPFMDERIDSSKIDGFSYASRKAPEFMCFRLERCIECNLIYAPEPPSHEFLENAYSEAEYDSSDEAYYAAKTYARYIKQLCKGEFHKGTAVDIGAGSGPLLPFLEELGYQEVIGIEPSTSAIESAPVHIQSKLINSMFTEELLEGKQVSLACSFMTLEHVSDPKVLVDSIYKILVNNGKAVFVVHNESGILNRVLGSKSPIIDIEHLQLFNPQAMIYLLESVGYNNVKVKKIKNAYPISYWIKLLPIGHRFKKKLCDLLKLIKLNDVVVSIPVGNIIVSAEKANEN